MWVNEIHALLPLPIYYDGLVFLLPFPVVPVLLAIIAYGLVIYLAWRLYFQHQRKVTSFFMIGILIANLLSVVMNDTKYLLVWTFTGLILALVALGVSFIWHRNLWRAMSILVLAMLLQHQAAITIIGVMAKI